MLIPLHTSMRSAVLEVVLGLPGYLTTYPSQSCSATRLNTEARSYFGSDETSELFYRSIVGICRRGVLSSSHSVLICTR